MRVTSALVVVLAVALAPAVVVDAFTTPSSTIVLKRSSSLQQPFVAARGTSFSTSTSTPSPTQLSALPIDLIASAGAPGSGTGILSNPLVVYLIESLISSGIPALFTIAVIAFAARSFRRSDRKRNDSANNKGSLLEADASTPAAQLYNDLYGDQQQLQEKKKSTSFFRRLMGAGGAGAGEDETLPSNVGVPGSEYIHISNWNQRIDSYRYSMQSAVETKASAAADFRSSAFKAALGKTLGDLSGYQRQQLLEVEQEFLRIGAPLTESIAEAQTLAAQTALDAELVALGIEISVYAVDPNATAAATAAADDENSTAISRMTEKLAKATSSSSSPDKNLARLQADLQKLQLVFIQQLVKIVGPSSATAVREALLGDMRVRGSDGLLGLMMSSRPLSAMCSNTDSTGGSNNNNIFVTRFPGDTSASQVNELREVVTAILGTARDGDEALVVLQTGGGTVTGYGLAAAQLLRLKEAGLKLTVAVEQVAASGGYMMCCVADHIIASPFAVLGSIGVISDMPNVYERLQREGIEFQTVTAGKYKRTLTPTKKPNKEDYAKTKADVQDIFELFRDFVADNRPQLDIERVATGETWFGKDALDLKLCDEIRTVDSVLVDFVDNGYTVLEVEYEAPIESPFGRLLPSTRSAGVSTAADGGGGRGWLRQGIGWIVRSVADEVTSELSSFNVGGDKPLQERYMAESDEADRVRTES